MPHSIRKAAMLASAAASLMAVPALAAPRQAEYLDRGLVAAPAIDGGMLVSWRISGDDALGLAFNVYRDGKKLNAKPLAFATNFVDKAGVAGSRYTLKTVIKGKEVATVAETAALKDGFLTIPLQKPPGGVTPDGVAYEYTANDASVGDLDGDGRYEIILKWDPTNSKDNAFSGYTGPVLLDAYTLDGKRLWRIDLGRNIRAGAHYTQFQVFDFDGDGRDEIVYGSMALDADGKPLWTSKLYHGDALHLGDLDPDRPGLERFGVNESPKANGGIGSAMLDAKTGEILWTTPTDSDTGRGVAFDIDPRFPGAEAWASNSSTLYTVKGKPIEGVKRPPQMNFGVWWDGDELRELLDRNKIFKWDWLKGESKVLLNAEGMTSNNGTKATPTLSADILGDWREEVILRSEDNTFLRIYVTPYPTDRRLVTLMHDPVYRAGIAWQNTAYNQPPHTSFYLGHDMKNPPRPDIAVVKVKP